MKGFAEYIDSSEKDTKKKKSRETKGIKSNIHYFFKTAKNDKDEEMCQPNYDLATNKTVGYGHI